MAIHWTENLSVGLPQIDDQHKVWFEKAEALFEAGKKGEGRGEVSKMLDFLEAYTKQHFQSEETYMKRIGYPMLEVQQKAHAGFVQELKKLREDFNQSGGNLLVILNANRMVINWLTNHISVMDKKIGAFAADKG